MNIHSKDVAYRKVLVDAAEQFFNGRIKDLEQVSINRIIETFVSGSAGYYIRKAPR
jgi:hypothetical protein